MKITVDQRLYRRSIHGKEISTINGDNLSVARFHFIYTIILDYK